MAFSGAKDFERLIEGQFQFIGSTVRKTDPPVRVTSPGNPFRAVWATSGALDFEGGFRGFFCSYDAKVCAGRRFKMRRIEGHQLDRMEEVEADGGLSGAILEYEDPQLRTQRILLVPYRTLRALLDDGARSLTVETVLQLCDQSLENAVHYLDPYDYRLLERALLQELRRTLDARGITVPAELLNESEDSEEPVPETPQRAPGRVTRPTRIG